MADARSTAVDDVMPLGMGDIDYAADRGLSPTLGDDDFDPVSLVAAEPTMRERLMYDLRSALPDSDFRIADYLVGNLDDRGFLVSDVDTMASEMGVSPEHMYDVLQVLQRLGPPGIGARDPRECLILQLDYLKQEKGKEPPHVRDVLTDYFVELGEHKYNHIAHKLGISLDEVDKVREYIRSSLTPFPVMNAEGEVSSWGSPSKAQYVAPDVIIREGEDDNLEVEVVESRRIYMRLNPLYNQMANDLRSKSVTYSEQDKKHVQEYVSRAKMFMSNINQRRETMNKIARTLVEYQDDFLRQGIRHLKPLTRAQVAMVTGLHESTAAAPRRANTSCYPTGR